jgi:hypothetical protein
MAVDIGFSSDVSVSVPRRMDLVRLALRAHAPLIIVAFALAAALHGFRATVLDTRGQANSALISGILTSGLMMTGMMLLFYNIGAMVLSERPQSPIRALLKRLKAVVCNPVRLASGVFAIGSLMVFTFAFVIGKSNATTYMPFSWDKTFDAWDVALHFGYRPYEFLMPVFGNVVGVLLLNANYLMWFFFIYALWFHFAFMAKPGLERTRFFFSFFLVWSLGGIFGAALFSSAGPCYFQYLNLGDDPYAPLMASLAALNEKVPVASLSTQSDLWKLWSRDSVLGGVSAMPSMHNATSVLFVLASWNMARWIRWTMIAHAVLILVGAVVLGWHYAVDAYLAWGLAIACWVLGGRLARWWEDRPAQKHFAAVFENSSAGFWRA